MPQTESSYASMIKQAIRIPLNTFGKNYVKGVLSKGTSVAGKGSRFAAYGASKLKPATARVVTPGATKGVVNTASNVSRGILSPQMLLGLGGAGVGAVSGLGPGYEEGGIGGALSRAAGNAAVLGGLGFGAGYGLRAMKAVGTAGGRAAGLIPKSLKAGKPVVGDVLSNMREGGKGILGGLSKMGPVALPSAIGAGGGAAYGAVEGQDRTLSQRFFNSIYRGGQGVALGAGAGLASKALAGGGVAAGRGLKSRFSSVAAQNAKIKQAKELAARRGISPQRAWDMMFG